MFAKATQFNQHRLCDSAPYLKECGVFETCTLYSSSGAFICKLYTKFSKLLDLKFN